MPWVDVFASSGRLHWNDVALNRGYLIGLSLSQKARRDIPTLAFIGDHRHGLLVVFHQHASDRWLPLWGECHALPDTERQHRAVSPHLLQKTEPFNDFVVKLDQFRFCEFVNVNLHDFLELATTHPAAN